MFRLMDTNKPLITATDMLFHYNYRKVMEVKLFCLTTPLGHTKLVIIGFWIYLLLTKLIKINLHFGIYRPVHTPGRKEMFLFNDVLNTFYLRLYGFRHNNSKGALRGNPLPPHGLLFPINNKLCYMHHPIDRITHTTSFATPVVGHWL